jgi:hypothetical protein
MRDVIDDWAELAIGEPVGVHHLTELLASFAACKGDCERQGTGVALFVDDNRTCTFNDSDCI